MGLRLQPRAGKLWVEPGELISAEARKLIVENRDGLLDLVSRGAQCGPVPPCPATVTERAALIEDGDGCGRTEADDRALAEFGLPSWSELGDTHAADPRGAGRAAGAIE